MNWPARLLFDGAMGTELIARGLDIRRDCAEAWNLSRPDDVRAVHAAYFAAGAKVAHTNSFGGNRIRLARFGLQAEVRAINLTAAILCREMRPTGALVAGDMGPTGGIPPPEGIADLIELEDAFAEQAMLLAEGGVDFLHIETLYHPKEARAAVRGAREGAPGLRVVASMTCRRHGAAYATTLGFAPEVMLAALIEEGAHGVGINCTLAPADMLDLLRLLRARTQLPILAQPTLAPPGLPELTGDELGAGALALFAAGATAIGGCCGAGPDAIASARHAIDTAPASLDELSVD